MNNSPPALAPTVFTSETDRGRVAWGTLTALALHGAFFAITITTTTEVGSFARSVLEDVRSRWTLTYELKELPAPPPPPVTEKPEPPQPEEQASTPAKAPLAEPPPAAAEAAQVLAAEADPSAPLDLTGQGFITGNAESYAGGYTTAKGTAKTAVSRKPAAAGVPGGTGKVASPYPSAVDLSKAATWASGDILRRCGFPPEADAAQVDFARVVLTVSVSESGAARTVSILSETPSGLGFGGRAKSCANRTVFVPGRDRNGKPVASTAGPITVNFTRAR